MALIDQPVDTLDTPTLILDLDALEHNLTRMADSARKAGVQLRPHAKAHKSAEIARLQIALGAVGVCCQKLSEAEAMVQAGVDDVLVTYPIVGPHKMNRLAGLARHATVAAIADNPDQVAAFGRVAREHGVTLTLLVDVYPGGMRGGVDPGVPALRLSQLIAGTPGLAFGGLQAYNGAAQHVRDYGQRRQAFESYADAIRDTRDRILNAGLPCASITGSGTGTFAWEAQSGVFTELQPGSYVFMDADYALNQERDADVDGFRHSLFVLTTVVHSARAGFVLVDAGVKALNTDPAQAWVWGQPDLLYTPTGDEQGRIDVPRGRALPALGQQLLLVPGHCDPTVNLHDEMVAVRASRVQAVWPVTARGAMT